MLQMTLRPKTLNEVAERSDTLEEFGWHLRDWLHELRNASSRREAAARVATAPRRLRDKFPQGSVADAWLGAYAEHLSGKVGSVPPKWASSRWRILDQPLFDAGATSELRRLALAGSPLAFKRRNIFTPAVDLPLRIRAGRPGKSLEEKRRNNAERQRRYRKARSEELAALRKLNRASA